MSVVQYLNLMFQHSVWIFVKEHFVHRHVKRRNHFLRVCYQLTVEIGVELTQVLTVEVEERLADDTYLCTHTQLWRQVFRSCRSEAVEQSSS